MPKEAETPNAEGNLPFFITVMSVGRGAKCVSDDRGTPGGR